MTTTSAEPTDALDAPESSKPSYDDVNVPVVVLVGIISALVTFMTIALVQGMCYQWQNSKLRSRSAEAMNIPAREYINEQKHKLDGGNGTVSIEDAMKKVIDEYGKE